MKELSRPWAWGLLTLLVLLPWYRVVLFSDQILHYRDLIRDILPAKAIWRESVMAGHGIPYWNHFSHGGIPYWAQATSGPLHPLNFLFLLFPASELSRVLSFFLLIHYGAFAWGSYALFRSHKVDRQWAVLCSASLACSGLMLGLHNLAHMIGSLAGLPWLVLVLGKFQHSSAVSWRMLAGLALGWPIIAGDPQLAYLFAVGTTIHLLFRFDLSIKVRLKDLSLVALSALCSSAIQLLPTLAMALDSGRTALSLGEALSFSFHPLRFAETLMPLFYGNRFAENSFWAEGLVNFPSATPFVFSTYMGFLTVLGLFSLLLKIRSFTPPKADGFVLGFFGLVLAIASFGIYGPIPVYEFLFRWMPGFSLFRYPERLLVLPLLAGGFLGLFALSKNINESIHRKRLAGISLATLAAIGLLGLVNWYWSIGLSEVAIQAMVAASAFYAFAATILMVLRKGGIPVAVGLLLGMEIFCHGSRLAWTESKEILGENRYPIAQSLRASLNERSDQVQNGAAFRFNSDHINPYPVGNQRMDQTTAATFVALESLQPNTGSLFGLETTSSYFSLSPKDRADFLEQLVVGAPKRFDSNLYHKLMGTYYLVSRGEDLQATFTALTSTQPYLHQPRRLHFVPDFSRLGEVFRSKDFDASSDAVLLGTPAVGEGASDDRIHLDFEIEKRNGRSIFIIARPKLDARGNSILWIQLNESFDLNWRATVNGRAVEVRRSNGWAMALGIPSEIRSEAGAFEIEFRYDSPWILWGKVITFLFFFVLALLWMKGAKNTKKDRLVAGASHLA
jgi:hypothetical protein